MALVRAFFQMFIVLGMYNFARSLTYPNFNTAIFTTAKNSFTSIS